MSEIILLHEIINVPRCNMHLFFFGYIHHFLYASSSFLNHVAKIFIFTKLWKSTMHMKARGWHKELLRQAGRAPKIEKRKTL